jgi:hypothetical protein
MSGSVDYPAQTAALTVGCTNNVTGDVSILPFALTVDPGPISAGAAYTADLSGAAAFSEAFLDAAQAVILGGVREAQVIGDDGVSAAVAVRSGATGADIILRADFTTLSDRCELTGASCDPANDVPPNGNTDCLPQGFFNLCLTGFADVPVLDGTPNSADGCTQPSVGAPVPDCDCTVCDALDIAGCRPGDPDVPCTKGDECVANGFCVNGDLPLKLASDVGNYTAGASGTSILYGWWDGNPPATNPNGTLVLPAAVFSNPVPPVGVRVSAGGLFVALQCVAGVDSGAFPEGIATCAGGANDGDACSAPFDNSNNACVGSDDDGLACSQASATACTAGSQGECVNADCGAGSECGPVDQASPTPDALLIEFLVP